MNFGKMEEEYFSAEDWTGVIGLKLLGKIEVLAGEFWQVTFADRTFWNSRRPRRHVLISSKARTQPVLRDSVIPLCANSANWAQIGLFGHESY
jgi:hypothetical protein